MLKTSLVFLGTNACIPEPGGDTASYLVNGKVLIDTGWHVTETLRRAGRDPREIKALLFTHLHHDHIMALPALLFERYTAADADKLHIYGPEGLKEAIENADRYLQKQVYWPDVPGPQVHILRGGEEFEFHHLRVKTMPSIHAVTGLCYCVLDTDTGTRLGFPGDGEPQSEHAEFFRGCDALMHEFSLGLSRKGGHHTKHSSIWDAAQVAQDSASAMLCPVHGPFAIQDECVQELSELYSGTVYWPRPNDKLDFPVRQPE